MTLSVIQEALTDLRKDDMLSMAIRLAAKTDIRQCILMLQEIHSANSTVLSGIIEEYILNLIISYQSE